MKDSLQQASSPEFPIQTIFLNLFPKNSLIFGLTYRDDDPEPEGTVYVTLLAAGIEP